MKIGYKFDCAISEYSFLCLFMSHIKVLCVNEKVWKIKSPEGLSGVGSMSDTLIRRLFCLYFLSSTFKANSDWATFLEFF